MALSTPTVRQLAEAAKSAAPALARASTQQRNDALEALTRRLADHEDRILEANDRDVQKAKQAGRPPAILDRLSLRKGRVGGMVDGLLQIMALPDPLGDMVAGWTRPNGLRMEQVRVPLGVVGFIYEARPNVTIEAAGLCLKSGNALILRGGTDAWESNRVLLSLIQESLKDVGLPAEAVQGILSTDRDAIDEMLGLTGIVDVVIPRGGEGLIRRVVENARVPVIETGVGNCHVYVDETADRVMAGRIVINAKCQRPGVCNAAESLLVHRSLAESWLPAMLSELSVAGVEIRGDETVCRLFPEARAASEEDWHTEYLALTLAVRVVEDLEQAVAHIARYGTRHSEAIITRDYVNAERFLQEVDAAAVYVNASTRFTDGGEFGFGAEVGISTQKLHARGPMGLKELTTTKYMVRGDGQVRG